MKALKVVGALMTGSLASVAAASSSLSADVDSSCVAAVSDVNGKVSLAGGYRSDDADDGNPFFIDDEGGQFLGVASLSLPLGCMIGAQIDVGGGAIDGSGFGGVGGHLFIRDPSQYLVGLHAQYVALDGEDLLRIGPEFELYLDTITLSGTVQYEDLSDFNTDNVLAAAQVAFYATEDFVISAGYRHFLDLDVGAVGFEYQPAGFPASVFADAMAGTDDFVSVLAGVRFHFGASEKSLMARHREDDPPDYFNLLREPVCDFDPPTATDAIGTDPCNPRPLVKSPP